LSARPAWKDNQGWQAFKTIGALTPIYHFCHPCVILYPCKPALTIKKRFRYQNVSSVEAPILNFSIEKYLKNYERVEISPGMLYNINPYNREF